jgi:hypothetical protein
VRVDDETLFAGVIIVIGMLAWVVIAAVVMSSCEIVSARHDPCAPLACGGYCCTQWDLVGKDPKCAFGPCAHPDAGP